MTQQEIIDLFKDEQPNTFYLLYKPAEGENFELSINRVREPNNIEQWHFDALSHSVYAGRNDSGFHKFVLQP